MKILETQNALLTNYEVYQHILDTQRRAKNHKRRLPGNLATLLDEIVTYLREEPGPLARQNETGTYTNEVFAQLIERLRAEHFKKSEIVKGEIFNIFNIRPGDTPVLSAILEDMGQRFTEEEQQRIVEIIAEVLGQAPAEVDGAEGAVPSIENGN